MDKMMMKDILKAYGPSGREAQAAEVIKQYVAPYVDEVYTDAMGSLIAHKKGTSGKKIMLSAHMDQIGLIVVAIDDKGFLRVSNVGGVNPIIATAREVVFENGVKGVTYFENTSKHGVNEAKMKELYVDIGCTSREEAEKKVSVGDMAVYVTKFVEMGDRLSSGAMDDRICCAVMAEAMKQMKSEHDVYAVFTVQEEVGCRGAGPAAYAIEPDLNISIDVCSVGDIPECDKMAVSLGCGPTVKVMDSSVIVPPVVRAFMEAAAEEDNIPYQREVLRGGGTDTGAVQRTRRGILSGCVSIPTRYIHTPVETVDIKDIDNAVRLLCACLKRKELPHR